MKWLRPEPLRPYQISEDGKWIVNRVSVCGVANYALVRLGKRIVTRSGAEVWEGSVIVAVGARDECLEAMNREADDVPAG